MDQPYEIEAKYTIAEASTLAALAALRSLGAYQIEPADEPEQQRNIYFDTADMRLAGQGCGLRVREVGSKRILTFKSAGVVRDGLHERGEWEQELDTSSLDDESLLLASLPAGAAHTRALEATGGKPVLPIVLIETLRHNYYAIRDGRKTALLSLDEGVITAGGGTLPFRELEIELLPDGTRADLGELIDLLRARVPLTPEDRSKLVRGLELLDAGSHGQDQGVS